MGELEKLEHQRRNPHLYTTLSQSVNPDGSITTFDDVTRKLQETLKALDVTHTKQFGGSHPVYCMRPVYGQPEVPLCQMIEMIEMIDKATTEAVEKAVTYLNDRLDEAGIDNFSSRSYLEEYLDQLKAQLSKGGDV